MSYVNTERRLSGGEILILDGGTGTELERRGVNHAYHKSVCLGNVPLT